MSANIVVPPANVHAATERTVCEVTVVEAASPVTKPIRKLITNAMIYVEFGAR